MSDEWSTVQVSELKPGDRVRTRGFEFEVARIDPKFLGRDEMVCLVEDTPERWHAYPMPLAGDVEAKR
jgi:hypothetical protein